ncbi:hypothetical protein DV737_g248, partial [Chaetothyriales sp. CBS 132003]
MASDEDPASARHLTRPVTKSIHIGNIPYNTTGSEIGDIFSEYGPIKSVSPGTHSKVTKGYAFVNFEYVESAVQAVHQTNGRHLFGQHERKVIVSFTQPPVTFRPTSHKRDYPDTASRGDEWFESLKVPKGPAASTNASPPRGPRSMVRDVSPPDVRRTSSSVQASFRNHARRPSHAYPASRRSPNKYPKAQGYYEKSTAHMTGIDPYLASSKKSADHGRENEYEHEALDQNEYEHEALDQNEYENEALDQNEFENEAFEQNESDEIYALQKKARSLKASSTQGHWALTTQPEVSPFLWITKSVFH